MNRRNVASGLVCLAFAVYVYWLSGSLPTTGALDPLGSAFLPRALAIALGLFSAALVVTGLIGVDVKGGQAASPAPEETATAEPEPMRTDVHEEDPAAADDGGEEDDAAESGGEGSTRRVITYVALMSVYVFALPYTGFLLTSFITFTGFIFLLGQRKLFRAILASALMTGALYGLFGVLFGVRLPAGSIF